MSAVGYFTLELCKKSLYGILYFILFYIYSTLQMFQRLQVLTSDEQHYIGL